MGISDDIHRRKIKKNETVEIPVKNTEIGKSDVSDIIEPLPETNDNPSTQKETDSFFDPAKDVSKAKKMPGTGKSRSMVLLILLITLVLALIFVATYQNWSLIQNKLFKSGSNQNTTTGTKEVGLSTDNQSTNAATTTDTSQPVADQSPVATVAPVIDKTAITIRVSNGNGIRGSADSVRDALVAAGFKVASVGNASSYSYKTTIVYYKTGKEAEANLVKAAITGRVVSTELSSTLTNYDILVVVGKT